jgi:hypothetical protein
MKSKQTIFIVLGTVVAVLALLLIIRLLLRGAHVGGGSGGGGYTTPPSGHGQTAIVTMQVTRPTHPIVISWT